ncbi:hypothetical protein CFC21_033326 [Triticum aestivum]|uniref:Protein kinase domain-containing protein n=2 Tax=Triticum aestivum TaxID=4565 RepID=A0A3B6E8S1_WHEAT|nr:putative serine/threonine-protein kinase-like protein CCR3 [Triticum aestivum]KAF7020203.1 hypothetical protein CFC21_033326 [Triticum aestivum]
MALAGVGDAAAVTQLIGQAIGLVAMIIRAVDTVRQNRLECEHLACRVSTVDGVLSNLPRDQEMAPPLKVLKNTLEEAHRMVIACQNRGAASHFFGSRRHADCFNQVNNRIISDIVILNLSLNSYMARRHSNQVLQPSHIGVPTATIAMAPWPGSSSAPLQTLMVVSQQSQVSSISSDNPRALTWAEIAAATSFSVELGRGSSGRVYKGRLQFQFHFHHGTEVAVKVLEKHRRQGVEDAFMAESNILSGLRHDHIVRLVGWCAEQDYRMLVYEHMGKGTLRDHLQHFGGGPSSSPVTTSWETRVEVLLGVARAIHYLHCGADPLVIHRNVSSSNILLDGANWTPRLSGFGSAVFQAAGVEEHGGQLVEEVVGTPGYIEPEYSGTHRVSAASDVYSFGVVVLEALTGRPPDIYGVTLGLLVDSVLPSVQEGKLREVLDGHSALQPTPRQMEALDLVAYTASRCLCPRGHNRLAMSDVVANLHRALQTIRSN